MTTKHREPDRNTHYGCLTCFHSRLAPRAPLESITCERHFKTSKGRACGKYDAAAGRMV